MLVRKIWYGEEETSSNTKSFNFKRWSRKRKGVNTACRTEYRVCNVAMAKIRGLHSSMICVRSEMLVKRLIRVG